MVKRHQKFHWIYLERGLISRHLFIWLNEISTYYGYLMPNPAYIYIYIYIYSERETEKVIDRQRQREGEKMVKRHQKFHWIYLERGLISRHLFIWLNEISTYYGYLMPNPAYIYIYIYIYSERETEKVIDRQRQREGEKMVKRPSEVSLNLSRAGVDFSSFVYLVKWNINLLRLFNA